MTRLHVDKINELTKLAADRPSSWKCNGRLGMSWDEYPPGQWKGAWKEEDNVSRWNRGQWQTAAPSVHGRIHRIRLGGRRIFVIVRSAGWKCAQNYQRQIVLRIACSSKASEPAELTSRQAAKFFPILVHLLGKFRIVTQIEKWLGCVWGRISVRFKIELTRCKTHESVV